PVPAEFKKNFNILVAPSGFKGNLSPEEVAAHISTGVSNALPEATVVSLPIPDGGEGFVQTLCYFYKGKTYEVSTIGPLGSPLRAQVGLIEINGKSIAIVEAAAAAGLNLVPLAKQNPLH